MAVRIIKKSWWIDFRFNYRRYRKRSPENSRAGAQAYEAVLRGKLARGESVDEPTLAEMPTFEQFSRRWLNEYVVVNNKPSEQRRKKYALDGSIVPFFGKMRIDQISANDIERYKSLALRKGSGAKTINNLLSIFRKCVWTAYEWLELDGLPPKVRWLKTSPPKTDYLTPDECELMLSHSQGIVREMILTALRTGMRQGELKGLQWSSIDWQNQSIAVCHSRSDYTKELGSPKSGRERHIPMDRDIQWAFLRRKKDNGYVFLDEDGKPFDHKRLTRRLANVRREAGTRTIGWHTFRHTFASQLVLKGVPLPAVQLLMGHSTIAMTMRYTHLGSTALRAAIDQLAQELPQPPILGNPWATDGRESFRHFP
jgi:integrase